MIAWIFLRVRRRDGRVLGRDEGCGCAWKLKEHAVFRTFLAASRTLEKSPSNRKSILMVAYVNEDTVRLVLSHGD